MKPNPRTFAALAVVALLVTAESAVVCDRAARLAAGWWERSPVRAAASGVARSARVLVRVVTCGAKP